MYMNLNCYSNYVKLFSLRAFRLVARGPEVKLCAGPERKFSFVLILCHCLIYTRPWNDFGVPLGAGRPPKGSPETSQRQPQTFQTASLECLWGAFGRPGLPRGAGGLKETTQAAKNGPPAAKARRFKKHFKNDEH